MADTEIKQENKAAAPGEDFALEWLDDFSEEATPPKPEAAPAKPAATPPKSAATPPKSAATVPAKPVTTDPAKPAEPVKGLPLEGKVAAPQVLTDEVSPKPAATVPAEPAEPAPAPKKKKKKSAAAKRRQRERERARRRQSRVARILMVVCVIVAIGSAAMVIRAVYYYQHADSTYNDARENAVSMLQTAAPPPAPIESDPVAESEPEEETRPEGAVLDINFEELKAVNPDVVGWLHVPALDLSYPVMQGEDNEYYLTHTLEDEYNPLGSIFMECTNLPDFSHGNTLLYGHNTVDGTMFGRLREFGTDPSLRENEPYFYVYQADGRIGKYKIYSYYSVYKESDSFSWFTDDESYDYYVNMTKNLSIEPIEADFSERHNLVTLSTCFGASGTPYRFLVHGVRE